MWLVAPEQFGNAPVLRRLAALQSVGMEERRRRLADRKTQLRRLYLDHTVHERQDGCIGRRGDGERRRSADSESRFFKAFCTDGVAEYPTSYQSRFMERQKPMSAQLDSHTSGLGDIVDPKLGPRIRDSQRIVEFSNHAVSAQDAQQVAERAVQVVGEAYACSHVLVVELSGQEGGQRLCAGEGWNGLLLTSAANSVETHLREGPQAGDVDARPVAAPAYWLLNRQGLDALDQVRARVFSGSGLKHGLLVSAADRTTRLGLFAGTARKGRGFSEAQARLAQGILNVLLLAVERIRGQQEHQSRLKRQIEQAKRDWEAAVDALPQIICVLRHDGSVSRVNRAIEAWKLGSVKSVRSETLHDLLHPHCSDWSCRLRQGLKHAMEGLGSGPSAEFEVEDRTLSRYLRIKLRRSEPDGRPDRPGGELYALAVVEDISEQKRAERTMAHFNEELKIALQERTLELTTANAELRREVDEHIRSKKALAESEQKYEFIVQNTLTGIFLVRQGKIAFCNKQFQHIFGYDDAELEHVPIERLIRHRPITRPSNVTPISGVAASIDGCVCKGIRKGKREIWVRQSFVEINRHGETLGLGAVVDITDQVNAESELEASREELQILSSQLLCSQEEERKRIAVELHDSVGQSLSAIKLSVEQALDDVERASSDRQKDKLAVVVRRIRDTIEEVRRISMDLRPAVLDDFGATAALEWLCRELQSVFPTVRINLEVDVDEARIDDTLKVAIFRIVQEALHNAFKHAASDRVRIRLGSRARLISLSIHDNGRGFDLEKAASRRKGLGLGSMKERAKLSGGTLEVTSSPGRGTVIEASWPV